MKNSEKRKALSKLILFSILFFLIFTSYGFSPYVKASESERTTSKSNRISKEDERLIDQFLDETMGIDPARTAIEKDPAYAVKPTSAFGFSLNTGYGVEKNVLNSSWLKLNSRKYYGTADFFYSRRRIRVNSLNIYAFLDNSHYVDLDTESDKQEFYTRAQGKLWVTETNALGVSFSYSYRLSFDADYAVENEPIPEYKNEEYIVTVTTGFI